jgi:hypothetical protein
MFSTVHRHLRHAHCLLLHLSRNLVVTGKLMSSESLSTATPFIRRPSLIFVDGEMDNYLEMVERGNWRRRIEAACRSGEGKGYSDDG